MKPVCITTCSAKETQKLASLFVKELTRSNLVRRGALVVALEGDLGGGKTTFAQGFACGLDIREKVLSPTFVIMRSYNLRKSDFRRFVHIDAYRLRNSSELHLLGWQDILKDIQTLVLVEWANRIRKVLPREHIRIQFEFVGKKTRKIIIQNIKW